MPWRKKKTFGITEAIMELGVSPERLRYWEIKGIIKPYYMTQGSKRVRRYSHDDISICRELKKMLDEGGYTLKGAAERLNRPYKE